VRLKGLARGCEGRGQSISCRCDSFRDVVVGRWAPTRAAGARAMENISLSNFLVIVVAVPLVVAVIGALLGNWIDRWLATVNANYRRESEEREAADAALFAELEERGLLPIFLMRRSYVLTIQSVLILGIYFFMAG
jgi:hypothetical protein